MKGRWKQKSKKKGNAVLQKYMVSVDEFVKSKTGVEEVGHDHGLTYVKKKSRKEMRKEKRKMKKAKMKSHYEGNKTVSLPPGDGEGSGIADEKPSQVRKKREKAKKEESKPHSDKSAGVNTERTVDSKMTASAKKGKRINKLQESRKMALMEANEQEDREIKKLERCLGLNKRKNKKSLPQSFVADGLDYILGMLDSGSSAVGMYDEDDDMDMAKENFEKLDEDESSDVDEKPGAEMESEGSDEDMGSFGDDDDDDGDGDDDEMADEEELEEEEEEEEEEMKDDQDEMEESDENEGETEEEADTPDKNTPESKSETVSSETLNTCSIPVIAL